MKNETRSFMLDFFFPILCDFIEASKIQVENKTFWGEKKTE